jgi:hypothetical protein
MLKEKVVLSLAILAILCWGIVTVIRLDNEFNWASSKSITVVEFPVYEGKVIIGNKAIEEKAFKNLVQLSVTTATASASIQNKTESIIGGQIDDISLGYWDEVQVTKTLTIPEISPFENNWTKNMIYTIYKENKPLIHRMIDIYKKKWYDKEFKQKVENFVKENE